MTRRIPSLNIRLSVGLVLTLISLMSSAGTATAQNEKRVSANVHIKALKSGVLLVRLQDKSVLLEQLKSRGASESKIAEVITERDEENNTIVSAFRQSYTFSPVYFFYSSQSDKLIKDEINEIVFLKDDLTEDPSIRPASDSYYVAEFTLVTEESTADTDISKGERINQRQASAKTDFGGHSLVIKDSIFRQLDSPFPFYVKTFSGLPFKRKYKNVVRILNERLVDYHGGL